MACWKVALLDVLDGSPSTSRDRARLEIYSISQKYLRMVQTKST